MGFAVASKGAPVAGLLKKFLHAAPAASALGPISDASARRLLNTGATPHRRDESNVDDSDGRVAPGFSYPSAPRSWVSKVDDDALELKVAILGIAKEQVKLSAYQDGLLLVKWDAGDEHPAWYSWSINLSAVNFKMDQTKAEMEGGLLTLTVPKSKGEVVREYTDIKIN